MNNSKGMLLYQGTGKRQTAKRKSTSQNYRTRSFLLYPYTVFNIWVKSLIG